MSVGEGGSSQTGASQTGASQTGASQVEGSAAGASVSEPGTPGAGSQAGTSEAGASRSTVARRSVADTLLAELLSGSILTRTEVRRYYPYLLFIAGLMFLYIANGYYIQRLHRQHDRLEAQITELRARSLTISSQRMVATRQSEVMRELEERGIPLIESVSPPKIVER